MTADPAPLGAPRSSWGVPRWLGGLLVLVATTGVLWSLMWTFVLHLYWFAPISVLAFSAGLIGSAGPVGMAVGGAVLVSALAALYVGIPVVVMARSVGPLWWMRWLACGVLLFNLSYPAYFFVASGQWPP